jgi:hypothetical protein
MLLKLTDASAFAKRIGAFRVADRESIICHLANRRFWLNTIGTYGADSASYWWGRAGSFLQRATFYICYDAGLGWLLRFADDFKGLSRGSDVACRMFLVLLLWMG